MTSNHRIILHIVYIHGFQGDHTTFQSFPTDLHNALQPMIPEHIELRSILYPTYKSKRPIAVATEKFLQWLAVLPTGPVILCGHSMGGLLAAEAATSSVHVVSKRVVALLAFDVPFLGMHPHVVVTGLASLLPHQKREGERHDNVKAGLKTEKEMNDAHVDIEPVTQSSYPSSPNASQTVLSSPPLTTPSPSTSSLLLTPPPLPPRPSSSNPPIPSQQAQSSPHTPAVISRTLDFLQSHADDRLVHFISKHRSEPIAAARRWVVESLEFGICMFDPKGLRDRYAALERWHGTWVAFWTETVPSDDKVEEVWEEEKAELDGAEEHVFKQEEATILSSENHTETASTASPVLYQMDQHSLSTISSLDLRVDAAVSGPMTKSEDKAFKKEAKKQAKVDKKERHRKSASLGEGDQSHPGGAEHKASPKRKTQSPHHFVVRPFREPSGFKHRWQQVKIRGAKDEVEAHCGLFIRDINLEYDHFVHRVAEITKGWVDNLVR